MISGSKNRHTQHRGDLSINRGGRQCECGLGSVQNPDGILADCERVVARWHLNPHSHRRTPRDLSEKATSVGLWLCLSVRRPRRGVAPIYRALHRSFRLQSLHVREQFPAGQAIGRLHRAVECLQTHHRQRVGRRRDRALQRHCGAGVRSDGTLIRFGDNTKVGVHKGPARFIRRSRHLRNGAARYLPTCDGAD
jgi:hypothetical protein